MNYKHVLAVFKAEYYTTTSKFRSQRKYVPALFLLGVFAFSFLIRIVYDFFRGGLNVGVPPITAFFSIIAIFSYFTLFAPLLSPLGRVVYDGGASSRREVALNSPVSAKDLMYGNLLSNLAFFLPFFGFVGTLSLTPFIGAGIYSPFITSISLFGVLSLLILIGLVGGTLISPLIFNLISNRKNSETRAVVAFGVSAMLIFSLPIFRFFLENTSLNGSLGWIAFLPFTLAAIVIIFILYGVEIGLNVAIALTLLICYIIILLFLGYFSANKIYDIANDQVKINSASPENRKERLLDIVIVPFPNSIRNIIKATMKSSLRDIEHLARLTIGLSITVFMIFALSSQGLFRDSVNFDERIELAVIVFALVLSSSSVIFIEASSFTIQHRDMFALIKSAPNGSKKFIIGKVIQMQLLLTPIYACIIVVLSGLGFISINNIFPLSIIIILVLLLMTTLSLAIYLLNPSDNEEDLGNFINLILFYLLSFIFASIPVAIFIGGFTVSLVQLGIVILLIMGLSVMFTFISIQALELMNLETLNSEFSLSILHGFKAIILFIFIWNVLPLFAISYLLQTEDIIGFLVLNYVIIGIPIAIYYLKKSSRRINFSFQNMKNTTSALLLMLLIGFSLNSVLHIDSSNQQTQLVVLAENSNLILLFLIIIFSSVVEELFFRGFLLEYSEKVISKLSSLILNCFLFGLIHILPLISFLNAILQTILLVCLKRRTDSVFYPCLAHITYNIVIIVTLSFI